METVHLEDVSKVEAALLGRGDFDLEYRIILPDQSLRWVRDRGFCVQNGEGQISRVIGMAEDVTDQKNLEEKLEQSVDLLAALFDKMGSGILVEDGQLRVRHINKAFFELLNIEAPLENIVGLGSGELFSQAKISGRRVEGIRNSGIPIVDEELDLDGKILSFNYVPLFISRMRRYHLWQVRTIEEELADDTDQLDEFRSFMES
jgi:transcriptional regulator with PAS, ATPase and Fis domain